MKTRSTAAVLGVVAVAVTAGFLVAWPFATSMALVFATLALVVAAIARDAFVPDRTEDR